MIFSERRYGPFTKGELVYEYGGGFVDNVGMCVGIVVKSGPEQYEVYWEADYHTRHHQTHEVIRRLYPIDGGVDWYERILKGLRLAAGMEGEE